MRASDRQIQSRRLRKNAAAIGHRRVRSCGECDACCTRLAVPGVTEEGCHCEHRADGGGCAIYADRPMVCRAYACVWIVAGLAGLPELREDERPDRVGLVVTAPQKVKGCWLIRAVETRPGALEETGALRLRARMRRDGWAVVPVRYEQRGIL